MTWNHKQPGFTSWIHCPTCPGLEHCGESNTAHACPLEHAPPGAEASKILHPKRADLGIRLSDCLGLDFDVVARPQDLVELPRYIPCVPPRPFVKGALSFPAVAVPLHEVVSLKAQSTRRGLNLRHRLGIPPETNLILTGFYKDQLLESIWPRRHTIIREIAALNFNLVTAFGYSVYDDDTRLEHMYNMKRSLITYQLLQSYGVPAIPHIYWFNRIDLDRWCHWLHDNPSVSMLAIDLQTCDSSRDWESILAGLEYLEANAPATLSYLIYGPAHPTRISALVQLIPRLHLSNQYPFLMAVKGYESICIDGQRHKIRSHRPHLEIFIREVQKMQALVGQQPHNRLLLSEPSLSRATGIIGA